MQKNIVLLAGGAVILVAAAGYLFLGGGGGNSDQPVVLSECVSLCADAENFCPSRFDEARCLNECEGFSEETREHLAGAESCEELAARPELISNLMVSETSESESSGAESTGAQEASEDCEAACNHYVMACLTLVPNATEALFDEGYDSCLGECGGWDAAKTECMIGAFSCEAMTEQCGL